MDTRELIFKTRIQGERERIFNLVADMPNYGRWLPGSSAFERIINVEPYPVRLGTTYLDAGPVEKPGSVTEYDPPNHISFHHTVKIRQRFVRTDVDAQIRYSFELTSGVLVVRTLRLAFNLKGISRLTVPFIVYGFRKENVRTMAALKRYVEQTGK
jgi:hypothetical protein